MLPRVIFHHVNKCAGSTVLKYLAGTAPPERSAFVENLVAMDDPHGVNSLAAILRSEFLHDPYGLHDWKALLGNAVDVVFLRDPVDRLHSEWRMIQRWDDALMDARDGRYLRLRGIARRGFAEFLSLPGAAAFGNAIACHMARDSATLAEIGAACKAGGEPPAALIRLLDGRLASIDVVGFVEGFGDSILRLQARLGLLPAGGALQSHNVHAAPQQMSPEDLRLAEACTAIDHRLVAAARQRSMETGPIDHSALERAARGKYEGRLLDPPASILIEMGQGICSKGWHPCELHGLKRSRWIGPGPVAELDMRIDRSRALLIRLRADSHLSPRQVDGLRIHADGQALSTDHWALPPFDHFFEATVPPSPGAPPLLRLQIDSVQTLRPPNTGDPRLLGVEVGEIEVGPADGYIPRSLESLQTVRSKLSALAATTEKDWRMKALLDSLPTAG